MPNQSALEKYLAVLLASCIWVLAGCGSKKRTPSYETGPAPVAPDPGSTEPVAPDPGSPTEVKPTPKPPQDPARGGGDRTTMKPTPPGPQSAAQAIVEAHNRFRTRHCAPPLTWSKEVAAVAQAWANKLLEAGCAFEHSQGNKYGENLFFYGPAGGTTGVRAVDEWYSEVEEYDFNSSRFGMNTGHFTQVVWVGTREVGCGMARCSGGDIWVCNYNPPGNVMRQFAKNVLPTTCR